jgi:hypothetical protein
MADELGMRLEYLPAIQPVLQSYRTRMGEPQTRSVELFFINCEFLVSELESRFDQEASKLTCSEHWRSIFIKYYC